MLSIVPPLTKEDFINSGWPDVVNASEMKDCKVYNQGFWQKAREAEKAENIRQQALFRILGKVTLYNVTITEEYFTRIFTECDPLIDE